MGEIDIAVLTRRLTMMQQLLHDLDEDSFSDPLCLLDDAIVRYAVERMLTLLVDLAAGINGHVTVTKGSLAPETVRESFTMMADLGVLDRGLVARLSRSVGMRNILIHQYTDVDLDLVATAVKDVQADYTEYVTAVATYLEKLS